MTVVKNATARSPGTVNDHWRIWASCRLLVPEWAPSHQTRLLYFDRDAFRRHFDRGPVIPVWQVHLRPRHGRQQQISAMVSPAGGKLMMMDETRSPPLQ